MKFTFKLLLLILIIAGCKKEDPAKNRLSSVSSYRDSLIIHYENNKVIRLTHIFKSQVPSINTYNLKYDGEALVSCNHTSQGTLNIFPKGVTLTSNQDGQLERIKDETYINVSFKYANKTELAKTFVHSGGEYTYSYDAMKNMIGILNHNGENRKFTYTTIENPFNHLNTPAKVFLTTLGTLFYVDGAFSTISRNIPSSGTYYSNGQMGNRDFISEVNKKGQLIKLMTKDSNPRTTYRFYY